MAIHDVDPDAPVVAVTQDGAPKRVDCACTPGCDGCHGVSRKTIPVQKRQAFERVYPFGWHGCCRPPPPAHEALIAAIRRGNTSGVDAYSARALARI